MATEGRARLRVLVMYYLGGGFFLRGKTPPLNRSLVD